MRIWHFALLPYLPDLQFKGRLRELVAIMRDWRDKGKTNHLLINKVMEYPKSELYTYYLLYRVWYKARYSKELDNTEFAQFANNECKDVNTMGKEGLFQGWHNNTYLRICMANLYEKHLAVGKSRVTDEEWDRLCEGYKTITRESYIV